MINYTKVITGPAVLLVSALFYYSARTVPASSDFHTLGGWLCGLSFIAGMILIFRRDGA